MANRGLRPLWITPLIALVVTPVRAQFCYVTDASRSGQGIELHFVPGANVFVRISKVGNKVAPTDRMYQQEGAQMHRLQPNVLEPDLAVSKVLIFRGEQALVSNGPHSGCTIVPSVRGSTAGVTMESDTSLPGIPTQVITRFLAFGAHQDNSVEPAAGDPESLK